MNKTMNKELLVKSSSREKVLSVLRNADFPFSIVQISRMTGMGWSTVRNIITELVCTGKVEGFRIGTVLAFKLKNENVEVKK